jgi:membrane-associated phospholipid phosphatase
MLGRTLRGHAVGRDAWRRRLEPKGNQRESCGTVIVADSIESFDKSKRGSLSGLGDAVGMPAAWCVILTALLTLFGPNAAAQDGQTEQGPPVCGQCGIAKETVFDTREILTAPARWQKSEWKRAGTAAAIVVGSVLLLDEPARDFIQDHENRTTDRIASAFEPFGAEYALGTLAGFALIGKLTNRPVARHVAFDGAVSGLIAVGLVVPALKSVSGRSRPYTGQGAHDFDPFSGADSFPSGHTAMAFALATSIAQNYDRHWVKGLSYGVAGLTAYARMEHDDHWLSDVVGGAFIGVGVARGVAALHRSQRDWALEPAHLADGWGLQVTTAF